MKHPRNGRSLLFTVNDVPASKLLLVGFTKDEADTILKVRRVLPYEQDSKTPSVDARKLWENIGKPYSRFNTWAAFYIKPRLTAGTSVEISAFEDRSKPGRPAKQYTLSRDLAASLAMRVNTSEGEYIRRYFLLMERAAVRLADYNPIRANQHGGDLADQESLSPNLVLTLHKTIRENALPALRYYDVLTQHDHWRSPVRRQVSREWAIQETALKFDLPVSLVEKLTDQGVSAL